MLESRFVELFLLSVAETGKERRYDDFINCIIKFFSSKVIWFSFFMLYGLKRIPPSLKWWKDRHINSKYFQPERILSVVVNAAQRTRVKVEADSRPSVDTHPSGVQPSPAPGGTRHHNSHCFGGTSLYPCFRLVPLFLQNREEHHRTTGS